MSNASGDGLTEREIQLTILAVMDALDANVAFADADSDEFKRIIQKLQRNPASGQEPRLEIIERVIKGGGTLKAAWKEIKRVKSASGDDEELKEVLDDFQASVASWLGRNPTSSPSDEVRTYRAAVESLFGRIREERDRAREGQEALRTSYRDAVQGWQSALAELGRIREAALTPEEGTSLDEYLRGIVSPKWEDRQFVANIRAKLRRISGGALKEGATQ